MQQWPIPAKGKKTMTKTNQTRQISRRLTCQVISYLNGGHLPLLLKSILCQPHNHSILSHQIKNLKIKWLESNFRFINIVGLYPWTSWWRIKSFIIYKKNGKYWYFEQKLKRLHFLSPIREDLTITKYHAQTTKLNKLYKAMNLRLLF